MKRSALICCMCMLVHFTWAQYPAFFGQYMFTGLAINPGYAGSPGVMNATILYRNQWVSFPGAPRTQMFVYQAPAKDKTNNFGLIMGHDRLGVTNQFLLSGVYAYRIDMGKTKLAMGLQAGISSIQNRWEDLDLVNPGDQSFPLNTPAVFVPQFGTGIYLNNPRFFAGISIPELMKFKGSQYQFFFGKRADFRLWFFTAGYLLDLGTQMKLKPSLLLKYNRASKFQADLNLNLIIRDRVWVGCSYRTSDAVIGIMEFQATPQIRVGYAYERSISPLRYWNDGTHEVIVSYDFKYRLKTVGPRYF